MGVMTTTVKKTWYSKAGDFLRKFDNYALAIILALGISIFLAIFAIIFHEFPIDVVHSWLYDILDGAYAYILISRALSGIGYIFKPFDIACEEHKESTIFHFNWAGFKQGLKSVGEHIKKKPFEFTGLVFGLALGSGVSVALGLLGVRVNPMDVMRGVSSIITYVSSISTFSGLFNRLGRTIDFFKDEWANRSQWINKEHTNYALSVAVGVVIGIALVSAFLACNLLPGGGLAVAVVAIGVVSTCASSSGYIGRLFDIGGPLHKFNLVRAFSSAQEDSEKATDVKQKHKAEARGTAIGVGFGVILAGVLIGVGAATLPFFGLGLPLILAGVIVSGTCISVSGGLGNRIGYAIDKARAKKEAAAAEEEGVALLADASESGDALTPHAAPAPGVANTSAPQQLVDASNVAPTFVAQQSNGSPGEYPEDDGAGKVAAPATSLAARDKVTASMLTTRFSTFAAVSEQEAETYNDGRSKDFIPNPLENSHYTPIYSAGR